MHCAGIEYVWIWPVCTFVFCSIYLSIYTWRLWNEPIIFPYGIFKNLKERELLTSFSACAFMYCVELASLQWVMKHLLSEKKRMSYLSAALPYSIYISRGFIYNSGNSLIYCKTKKKKLFPLRSHFFRALFCLASWMCTWESGGLRAEGEKRWGGGVGGIDNSVRKI